MTATSDRDDEVFARLARAGHRQGLALDGARIRRTSSRFCLGIEHGDYNGTELFGVGTDRFLWLAYAPNGRRTLRLFSANYPASGVVELEPGQVPAPGSIQGWARYPAGVLAILQREGFTLRRGLDVALFGDIPGGGMSRSASLCINLILSLLDANEIAVEQPFRVAELAQAVENDYVGSPCGLLDQVMILFARAGQGTRFDPVSRSVTQVPLGATAPDFRLLALDTGVAREGLERSTYAARRRECQELLALLSAAGFDLPNLAAVRDEATKAAIDARFRSSHPAHLARLDYLFAAQRRFPAMLAAWQRGDAAAIGASFRADGHGLRDDYRISGPELETMCDLVRPVPGVLGERMLGGGDAGTAGAIVLADAVAAVRDAVAIGYPRSRPRAAAGHAVHELRLVDGVTRLARRL